MGMRRKTELNTEEGSEIYVVIGGFSLLADASLRGSSASVFFISSTSFCLPFLHLQTFLTHFSPLWHCSLHSPPGVGHFKDLQPH